MMQVLIRKLYPECNDPIYKMKRELKECEEKISTLKNAISSMQHARDNIDKIE